MTSIIVFSIIVFYFKTQGSTQG